MFGRSVALAFLPSVDSGQIATGNPITGSKGETLTVVRSAIRSCYTASGGIAFIAANSPALEAAGLSIEGSSNLIVRSQEFDNAAAWGFIGSTLAPTLVANSVVAPDGTLTADVLTNKQDVTLGGVTQSIMRYVPSVTVTSGANYTFSIWLKKSGALATDPKIYLNDGVTPQGTGAVVCALSAAWQRFSVTMAVASTSLRPTVGWFDQTANVNGQSIDMWGTDLELGTYARSYRQTAGGVGAISIDVATLSGAASLPVGRGELEVDVTPLWALPTNAAGTIIDTRNSTGSGLYLRVNSTGTLSFSTYNAGFFAPLNSPVLTWVPRQTYRIKAKWGGTSLSLSRDGLPIASISNALYMPAAHSNIRLGTTETGTLPLDGNIKNLRFTK